MTREEVLLSVKYTVARLTDVPAAKVSPTSKFADLGVDSLAMIEIAVAAEDEFGVRIDDDEAERLVTVDDVVDHVLESQAVS